MLLVPLLETIPIQTNPAEETSGFKGTDGGADVFKSLMDLSVFCGVKMVA